MKKFKKVNRTIRFDNPELDQALELDLDISAICRKALKLELKKLNKNKCPKCGELISVS